MNENDWLVEQFEEHRTHLRGVAYRMLGSLTEADDAVQETWQRLSRSDTSDVENLGGWLTTITSRVCLNVLRSRRTRREEPLDAYVPDPIVERPDSSDPEHEAVLADSVGLASARGARDPCTSGTAGVRVARPVRRPVRRDRSHRRPHAGGDPPARESRPAPGARRRVRAPIGPASGRWSTHSSPPRDPATSMGSSGCSTPTSCSVPTPGRMPA